MNLKNKMRRSCFEYCKIMNNMSPYVAGDIVEGKVTLDSAIDIVIYSEMREEAKQFLETEYSNIPIMTDLHDDYAVSSFADIYHTGQVVKVTCASKDPAKRNKELVIPAKEFFRGAPDDE